MIAQVKLPGLALRDAFLRMLDDYTVRDPENGELRTPEQYYTSERRLVLQTPE